MPGCPCPGCGMAGPRLLFLTALALELLGRAGGSQPALRSRGTATACRLDNKESESWGALLSGERLDTWICSLLGSLMVGLSGVFPLLVIPLEMGTMLRSEAGAWHLKQLLSFALGGLLGNVFLHLLPEAWAYTCSASPGGEGQSLQQQQQLGLWVIAGILTFLALEKMFLDSKEEGTSQAPNKDPTAAAAALNGGHCLAQPAAEPGLGAVVRSIKVSGYLNLLANTIDNFTHGLAVAASFLVSKKVRGLGPVGLWRFQWQPCGSRLCLESLLLAPPFPAPSSKALIPHPPCCCPGRRRSLILSPWSVPVLSTPCWVPLSSC
ncbi:SLC39A13 isoform 5 [Pongo abelii]|uniref:Zinc transporter ZIP13 n=2 Tax=Pongo abelii TaxID=9601 RepID=A0A2J8WEU9_PONAB|nr:SLC39A13 isoform 5 [Pongo abelii]